MRAIILAAGRGSRMGALTESRPKALVDVAGKPILEHLIRNASEAGIHNFLINVGYLGEMIQDHFRDGSQLGVSIEYFESAGKGPESPLFEARKYIEGDYFTCFCGDNILFPWQIELILGIHRERNADATFTIEEGESRKRVKVENGRIVGSSIDIQDPVLVYNMAMRRSFLDVLHERLVEHEDKAFAFAMDYLSKDYHLYIADIGPFININYLEDIAIAEQMLR